MSMIQFKHSIPLRTWLVVALIVVALLAVVAMSYLILSTGGDISHLHLAMSPAPTPGIMNGRP